MDFRIDTSSSAHRQNINQNTCVLEYEECHVHFTWQTLSLVFPLSLVMIGDDGCTVLPLFSVLLFNLIQTRLQLEFAVEDVQSGYAYIGLDSIRLVDPQTYQDMCAEQLAKSFTTSASESETIAFTPPLPSTDAAINELFHASNNISDRKKAAGSPVIKIKKLSINRKANLFPEEDFTATTTPKDPFDFKPIQGIMYGRKKDSKHLKELPEIF